MKVVGPMEDSACGAVVVVVAAKGNVAMVTVPVLVVVMCQAHNWGQQVACIVVYAVGQCMLRGEDPPDVVL